MNPRRSLLSKIADLFRRGKPKAAPRREAKESKVRRIEPLEKRIAPAAVIDASTIRYTDVGGDEVTIHFSKPILKIGATDEQTIQLNRLNDVFKFSGSTTFESTGEQDVQLIDLTKIPLVTQPKSHSPVDRASITIDAVPVAGAGDGMVKIGAINASNLVLGHVLIDGDLGQIDIGRASTPVALKSLTVDSLYRYGAATQQSTVSPANALESRIVGKVGLLNVAQDLYGYVNVRDGNSIVGNDIKTTAPARIDKVVIGGSLIGRTAVETASDNTGSINVQRTIGSVTVNGMGDEANAKGLIGGGGKNSGSIVASKGINSVTILDSLVGGGGLSSGAVLTSGLLAKVSVGNDLVGGAGTSSGAIQAGILSKAIVADTLKGGAGTTSGSILVVKGLSNVAVKDLLGGSGSFSGNIRTGSLGGATVSGSITGGSGQDSGVVFADDAIRSLVVDHDVVGGTATGAGAVLSNGLIKSVVVHGDVTGGTSANTGFVGSQTNIASVEILGTLEGGDGDLSGRVYAGGSIAKAVISKLQGGEGENSGSIVAATDFDLHGTLKSVFVKQGVIGGAGDSSGAIISGGSIGKVMIGTVEQPAVASALVGGEGNFSGSISAQSTIGKLGAKQQGVVIFGSVTGGDGDYSGSIQGQGTIALVDIRGDLTGGSGDFSGTIQAADLEGADGPLKAGDLGVVHIIGAIAGGAGASSGRVEAAGDLRSLFAARLESDAGTDSGSIVTGSGSLHVGNVGAMTLGGIYPHAMAVDPTVAVGGQLKSLSIANGISHAQIHIGQDLVKASVGQDIADSTITALGAANPTVKKGDVAIGSLIVDGNVSNSKILAGYGLDGLPRNADASINSIIVHGAWTASDLVAGVKDTNGDGFGNADDAKITGGVDRAGFIAKIAKVQVEGAISGTPGSGDHFGFVAESIGSFQNGATKFELTTASGQHFEIPSTDDVTIREVTA